MSKFQIGDKVRINTPGEAYDGRIVEVTRVLRRAISGFDVQVSGGTFAVDWGYKDEELELVHPETTTEELTHEIVWSKPRGEWWVTTRKADGSPHSGRPLDYFMKYEPKPED